MNWKEYENLTRWIYETIGQAHGVVIEGHGKDCKVVGKSGDKHQIDVLASHSDGFHKYLTDIECKYWNDNVDKDVVMKVHCIVDDCNFSKGIIVSKKGFTPDAIKYASHVGIDLVVLRKPTSEDWKGRIKNICVRISVRMPMISSVNIGLVPIEPNDKLSSTVGVRKTSLSLITFPDGKEIDLEHYLHETFCKDVKSEETDETLRYDFPKGTFYTTLDDGQKSYIQYLEITGHLRISLHENVIEGENYISYIMQSLTTDGASMRITSDNMIIKD